MAENTRTARHRSIIVIALLVAAGAAMAETPNHRFHTTGGAFGADQIEQLSARSAEVQARVSAFLDDTAPPPLVDYHI